MKFLNVGHTNCMHWVAKECITMYYCMYLTERFNKTRHFNIFQYIEMV